MMNDTPFLVSPDEFIGQMATLLGSRGKAKEVAFLVAGEATITLDGYDNWDWGMYSWRLELKLPVNLYADLTATQRDSLEYQ